MRRPRLRSALAGCLLLAVGTLLAVGPQPTLDQRLARLHAWEQPHCRCQLNARGTHPPGHVVVLRREPQPLSVKGSR